MQRMSMQKAIEKRFLKMQEDKRYSQEQITHYAHRWTYKMRKTGREHKICLDWMG